MLPSNSSTGNDYFAGGTGKSIFKQCSFFEQAINYRGYIKMSSLKISILDSRYLLSHITPTDHKRYAIESKTTLIRTIHELLGIDSATDGAADQQSDERRKHLLTPATEISCQQSDPLLPQQPQPEAKANHWWP
ncbi:MAG: hypothetical protein SCH70_13085 [Candidatus Methanoperedens sp.]|nr:hypothetical protein [Candidatus Methanoperedens sp.]